VKPSGRTETRQWTVDPRDGQPRGFAFVWRRFEISALPAPMLACVMATVPANELIRRTIKSQEDDPRMPAILEDDAWSTWLGEGDATPATAKAVLRTMESVNWQAAPEPKKPRPASPDEVPSREMSIGPAPYTKVRACNQYRRLGWQQTCL
jgi:putative SOS response-associated peptidase YedK